VPVTVKKSRSKKTPAPEPTPEPAPTPAPEPGPVFLVNAKQETSTILEPGWSKYLAVTAEFPITDESGAQFKSIQTAVSSQKDKFSADTWKPEQYRLYQLYLKQRYDNDAKFRAMIDTIKAANGTILFANGSVKTQDLGVGVKDGVVQEGGENLLGKWMLALS
jgi:hypothetical protein